MNYIYLWVISISVLKFAMDERHDGTLKTKISLLIFSSLFIITLIVIGMAVILGVLSIFGAILILALLDTALAISALSYYKQFYRGRFSELLLSLEFLDMILSIFLYQLVLLSPLIISMGARSPWDVIILTPLAVIGYLILSLKFPLGLFTKIEPLNYSAPYKVYLAKFEKIREGNAIVSGIIKPRIILFSPILEFLNEDEVKAVIAHEVGHIVNKDHLKQLFGIIISIIGIEIFALTFYYKFVVKADVGDVLFATSMTFSLIFPIFSNYYRKRMELKADLYASHIVGKDTYISALKKLAKYNLLPLDWESEDHPSIERRIEYVFKNGKGRGS
jgi:STE24 endopeptidase